MLHSRCTLTRGLEEPVQLINSTCQVKNPLSSLCLLNLGIKTRLYQPNTHFRVYPNTPQSKKLKTAGRCVTDPDIFWTLQSCREAGTNRRYIKTTMCCIIHTQIQHCLTHYTHTYKIKAHRHALAHSYTFISSLKSLRFIHKPSLSVAHE